MLLLSETALHLLHAAGYALLAVLVHLQSAWRALASLAALAAARLAAAAPLLRPALAALCALPAKEHIGSPPPPPTVLGVAVAEELGDADWPAAVEALGRLLAWAHAQGFRRVLVYEPSGSLQQPHRRRQLELQLLLQRLTGAVRLQAGWRGDASQQAEQAELQQEQGSLLAVLLSAADGPGPLLAAAAAGDHAAAAQACSLADAALDAAIAAPARLRERLQQAAGPLAGCEPDFVLVTGPALTLAGFPAWLVRTAEIYGAGPLAAWSPERLQAALRRFCRTKQRFGK